ncbi:MAG: FAD-dependent pyridine nucleotide-disulfide oxidoreductase [Nitrospirae bacterium]|nr:MAG: FAD-dependent pyridine nucleotide-disulfide oxidoreductase [Nitrospirota bacterium]
MAEEKIYDCIIIGAGPGGLQAAIYLGRYNRNVLLIDRGGGRTQHAKHIENFLTQKAISGKEIIKTGLEQARSFNVKIEKGLVTKVLKKDYFEIYAGEKKYLSKFAIVSSGVYDNLPGIENLYEFLGISLFTCVDCDGYKTTNKKLVIIGNSIKTVHLAIAMREMFTKDITLILYTDKAPEEYKEELEDENIPLIIGRPVKIIGEEKMEAIELQDGRRFECEVIMSHFGFKLNDSFLPGLNLKKDRDGFKYIVSTTYESSLSGLYIVGPLNQGNDQAVIAAGEGAVAAIDIKKRLLEL